MMPDSPGIGMFDHGPGPYVFNIERATESNTNFRTAQWTGSHMQLVLMSIAPGEDIGLEMHPDLDQFIRIEEGRGIVAMGSDRDSMELRQMVSEDYAIIVPAGTWHNLTNTGRTPLKLYTIYAPPAHPFGTVHRTKPMEGRR
jgi:mannose-6-phosphate isomerase-like protein (cupin superfamily)